MIMIENAVISIFMGGLLVCFFTGKLPLKDKYVYKYIIMILFTSAAFFLSSFLSPRFISIPASCLIIFALTLLWCEGSIGKKILWSIVPVPVIMLFYIELPVFNVYPSTTVYIITFQGGSIILSILLLNRNRISASGIIPYIIYTLVSGVCIHLALISGSPIVLWGAFIVSALIFVLFEVITRKYEYTLEIQTGLVQNEMIAKHYNEVQSIYMDMRGWRHDYHNHLQTIKGHIALNQMPELNEYLDMLEKDLDSVDTIIKTGNLMLDAILNSKVSIARNRNININVKAQIPEKLTISDIDLCVIIGNLIDNAIEACLKIENKNDRFIRIYIGVLKQQLYISVSNSIGGTLNKINGEYITTKDKSHGHGIKRINAIINKYSGYINRQNEPGVFATEIMLPL